VNGFKVDRPSYLLREGQTVSVREDSKKMPLVEEGVARSVARPKLSYIEVDKENLKGTLTMIPKRA
jgi:small subunit ribosomal protein S4